MLYRLASSYIVLVVANGESIDGF